jgi:hypothetical protein
LVQNRFRSILVAEDSYLPTLVRYVHLNPLHAGLVHNFEELAQYPWTGHRALMGGTRYAFHAVDEVLGWFASEPSRARSELTSWMRASTESRCEATTPAPEDVDDASDAARLRRNGWTLDTLVTWVCREIGADIDRVRCGGRTRAESEARAVIGLLATRVLGFSLNDVGSATGVSSGPLSRALARGARVVSDRGLELARAPASAE